MAISGFAVIGSRSCGPAATPISEIFATNNSENDRVLSGRTALPPSQRYRSTSWLSGSAEPVVSLIVPIAAGIVVRYEDRYDMLRTLETEFGRSKRGFMRTSAPSSVEGIEKYLASGMIRGIGPV
jgi:hypothetical protein